MCLWRKALLTLYAFHVSVYNVQTNNSDESVFILFYFWSNKCFTLHLTGLSVADMLLYYLYYNSP